MFLSFVSLSAQTYVWKNVAIGGGGFVTGIIPSKTESGLMYCRTDVGGAYRWGSTDSKWVPLLDWNSINETTYQGVEALALDPQASNKVYMLVGTSYFNNGNTAILRSTDYGNTFATIDVSAQFKAHGNGMGRQNGERLAVDPNNGNILWCGSRNNGLFKSTNAGTTWTNVTFPVTSTGNGNGINMIVMDPAGTVGSASQTFYVGVSQTTNNLYKTTNGGTTFTAVAGAPTGYMPQRAVLASDKTLYVAYADQEGPWNIGSGQLWKLNTTSGVWTNITPAGFTTGFGGISVDPANPNRIIASTVNAYWSQYTGGFGTAWGDRILLSTNGGTSWTDLVGAAGITLNPNGVTWINGHSIHWAGCVEFNPFNTAQAHIISGNGVFTCNNVNTTPTTWVFNSVGIEETVPLDIASITGGPLVSVIGDYDGFRHTDVTVFSPIHNPQMGTTTGLAYGGNSTSTLLRVGNNMYYSTNQGTSWTQCTMNGSKGRVAVTANGNVFLHCPESNGTFYRSTNNGTSWTTCNGINITDGMPVADMVNNNKVYAYNPGSGQFMVSTDAGQNFAATATIGTGGSKIIRTVPGQEGHIWVAMGAGGLRRSVNSGTSFTNITSVSSCLAVGLGKAAPSTTYHALYIWGTVGGVTGIFRSTDQGTSWTRVNDDAHEFGGPGNGQFVIGDMNVYGRVYMSTVGRGIVYADLDVPAPVEFLNFEAVENDGVANLFWQTASEINNSHFEIQRSGNGSDFVTIGQVAGAGNSSLVLSYHFEDTEFRESAYYRIRQVDLDGAFSYSDIRYLSLKSGSAQIFPNPTTGLIYVTGLSENIEVRISDLNGRGLLSMQAKAGEGIDLSSLSGGLYLLQMSDGRSTVIQKLTVVK